MESIEKAVDFGMADVLWKDGIGADTHGSISVGEWLLNLG